MFICLSTLLQLLLLSQHTRKAARIPLFSAECFPLHLEEGDAMVGRINSINC